jgi:hypothetical protein
MVFNYQIIWKCEIHRIPILINQMRLSTTYISSLMLGSKELEIRNIYNVKKQINPNRLSFNGTKSNLSMDRATYEGNHPLFWNQFMKFNACLIVKFIFVFSIKYRSTYRVYEQRRIRTNTCTLWTSIRQLNLYTRYDPGQNRSLTPPCDS